MQTVNKKYYLNVENINFDIIGSIMNSFGIRAGDLIQFEHKILGSMIAPDDKNPPISWSRVDFYDVEYNMDVSSLIPYDTNDNNTYIIHNSVTGEVFNECSPKVMALSSMLFFSTYLLEKNNNTPLQKLYQSIRALAYSSEFLNEKEQTQFFKLTD